MYHQDTIVALSTPTGSGAIGVIRVSGPDAVIFTQNIWKGKKILEAASHTVHFGRIIDENAQVVDEVVATLFIAPQSYTKENVVEISCHGSSYIIQKIIELYLLQGCRAAKPGEFTLRAYLNGAFDLSQAEAVADLIAANSAAAHRIAMQQMRGGFSNELQKLRTDLIHFASLIELELDFAEEDVEFANRNALLVLIQAIQKTIQRLLNSFQMGNAIKNGVPIVIAGKPNVGKSTLLNALLNEERAIVSDIAGTTRDTVEDEIVINGILFRFIDTAGIRETEDIIEAKGVERTLSKMKQAQVIIYLVDALQNIEEVETQIQEIENLEIPYLLLMNKEDLLNEIQRSTIINKGWHLLSAKNEKGVEELKNLLLEKAQLHQINPNEIIVTNIRHVEAMHRTQEALQKVQECLNSQISSDFLAMDIKQALYYLGEITGQVSTDDLLDNIFTKFCIGK